MEELNVALPVVIAEKDIFAAIASLGEVVRDSRDYDPIRGTGGSYVILRATSIKIG